ncbi:hypothetical protein [uncultured Roseobacter sp.]|nr:hypothetical protein [uncultured Roseobacter sp.]
MADARGLWDGIDLALNINGDIPAPITTSENIALFFKGIGKGFFGI